MQHARTMTETCSSLELRNLYRRFIYGYTSNAASLSNLLRKGLATELNPFGDEKDQAFHQLITSITSAPVLELSRTGLHFSIDTSESDYQVGAVLFHAHPTGTASR